jgi:hypothetical protein
MSKQPAEEAGLPIPSPEMLIAMSDFGPNDDNPEAIAKCRKRMARRRRNLGSPTVVLIRMPAEHEASRQKALTFLNGFCNRCGLCG